MSIKNNSNICISKKICNEKMKCTICKNTICNDCIEKIKDISIDDNDVFFKYNCPFCRTELKFNITDDKLEKEDTINIIKNFLIKSVYKYNQYEILKQENKQLKNDIEEMYMEIEDIKIHSNKEKDNIAYVFT